jgi:hypothetical protein
VWLLGIVLGAKKMLRDVWFIADDPTVVRDWRNIKQTSGEGDHGAAGNDHSHVFNIASGLSSDGGNVLRPPPSGFVTCAADGQSTNLNNFKFAFVEDANSVGLFKTLEYQSVHGAFPFVSKDASPSDQNCPGVSVSMNMMRRFTTEHTETNKGKNTQESPTQKVSTSRLELLALRSG